MEVEAVLEALVSQADQGPAGIDGPALGFEYLQYTGAFDAKSEVPFGSGLSLSRLVHLDEKKALLLPQGAVDLQRWGVSGYTYARRRASAAGRRVS